jgi:predicted Zn-ribbon and HTH transcriptional regulator
MRSLRCRGCGWTWVDFDDGCPGCRPDRCPMCGDNEIMDLRAREDEPEEKEVAT